MSSQAFAVRQSGNHGTQPLQTLPRNLLRGNVLLERLGVDPAELACIPIRWERMICARGVVTTTSNAKC